MKERRGESTWKDKVRETERRRTFYASYVVHAHTRTEHNARGTHTICAHRHGGILTHGIPVVGPRDGSAGNVAGVKSASQEPVPQQVGLAARREAISSCGEFDPSRYLHRFTRVTEYLVSDRCSVSPIHHIFDVEQYTTALVSYFLFRATCGKFFSLVLSL